MKRTLFNAASALFVLILSGGGWILEAQASENHSLSVQNQKTVTITGTVVDEAGEPVVGAGVMVVGTVRGAVTDLDGKFEISKVASDAQLQISSIGYVSQTIALDGRTSLDVVLAEDTARLDEVVVVGYGVTVKRDLIASVSTVDKDGMSELPVTNIVQGLAGRSPGMIVQSNGGGIDATPSISIRGGGEPLYVIDGVVRNKSDFAVLSADEIESISILKDASAAAVYGSRAANGIVQVQTKRGSSGRVAIEYDFNYSLSQPNIWPRKMHSYERAEYANIAYRNDGREDPYKQEQIQAMRDGSSPETLGDTDWRSLVMRDWAPQTRHTVRVMGGNNVHRYFVSLGHVDQNSLYKSGNHWMKRTNFRLSESATIESIGLDINATLDGYVDNTQHPYTSTSSGYYQVFSHINDKSPLIPGVNKYGLPYNLSENPVAETASDTGYNRFDTDVINGRGELIWTVPWVEGLKLRAASNYRYYGENQIAWKKDAAQYSWDSTEPVYASSPDLSRYAGSGYSFTNQAFAEYANTFGKHKISALAGFEQYYEKSNTLNAARENFDFDIPQLSVGNANTQTNSGITGEELGRAAWIFSGKYNYASKYYAEVNLRYDGSDYFAPGKRWGLFFSGSAAWVVTEEKFMRPLVERNIFNMLKLRASYGETGLDSSAGRFAYLTSYGLSTSGFVVDGKYSPSFTEGSLPSPDLTWYTSRQTDIGLDFSSLNNRLYGTFDYFYFSTKGYLVTPTGDSYLNQVIGIGMPMVKSNNEYRRAGLELQLGWRGQAGDFKYDVSGNFTYYDSMWARLDDESKASVMNPYQRFQQRRLSYYDFLYHNLGYYQSADEVFGSVGFPSAFNTGEVNAGDICYEDTNGDGKIDSSDSRALGKSSAPHGQFGLNFAFEYKGFYLNMLFQGSTSCNRYVSASTAMQTGQTGNLPVAYQFQTDFWTPDNRDAQYPRLMSNTSANANLNYVSSDFWLVNGAYLRMKDFSFGYDFKRILRNVGWISKLRAGISGQNIFTVSPLKKYGLDPENSSMEGYGYPLERVIAFNVSIGF